MFLTCSISWTGIVYFIFSGNWVCRPVLLLLVYRVIKIPIWWVYCVCVFRYKLIASISFNNYLFFSTFELSRGFKSTYRGGCEWNLARSPLEKITSKQINSRIVELYLIFVESCVWAEQKLSGVSFLLLITPSSWSC